MRQKNEIARLRAIVIVQNSSASPIPIKLLFCVFFHPSAISAINDALLQTI
jgi:hypothetical protein